jgi:hypothetical protein
MAMAQERRCSECCDCPLSIRSLIHLQLIQVPVINHYFIESHSNGSMEVSL